MRIACYLIFVSLLKAQFQTPSELSQIQRPVGVPGPVLVTKVYPGYSAEARAAGYQGTVHLYVEVDAEGKPSNVVVMHGLGMGLDEKAVEAVRQWKYQPDHTRTDGPQDILSVHVPFRLENPGPWHVDTLAFSFASADKQRLGEIAKPTLTRYVAPSPDACVESGTSEVAFTLGKDGTPQNVHAVRGADLAALVDAVKSWSLQPASKNGEDVPAQGRVRFACKPVRESLMALPLVYRVGGDVSAPLLQFKAEPDYSEEARKIKRQGAVHLYVQISPEGLATNIHVIRRLGMGLDEKAMEAVEQWRFKPGMKDGQPVTVEATIEVSFRLL